MGVPQLSFPIFIIIDSHKINSVYLNWCIQRAGSISMGNKCISSPKIDYLQNNRYTSFPILWIWAGKCIYKITKNTVWEGIPTLSFCYIRQQFFRSCVVWTLVLLLCNAVVLKCFLESSSRIPSPVRSMTRAALWYPDADTAKQYLSTLPLATDPWSNPTSEGVVTSGGGKWYVSWNCSSFLYPPGDPAGTSPGSPRPRAPLEYRPHVRSFPEEVRAPKCLSPQTTEMTDLFWSSGMMVGSISGVVSISPLSTIEDE